MKRVVWFVSPHGLGHLSRVGQVIAAMGEGVSHVVYWRTDRVMAGRFVDLERVTLRENLWDCEPVQDGPSRIDVGATGRVIDGLMAGGNSLRAELVAENPDCVICDISPYPLRVARELGVPGVFVGNFTWVDIMERYRGVDTEWAGRLAWLRECYRCANSVLKPGLFFPMRYLRSEALPIIARKGVARRAALREAAGAGRGERVALLYFGVWGAVDFDAARALSAEGWRFVALTSVPSPAVELDGGAWTFPDVLASADAVVGKLGYGTVGEAMANRCPVVFYPRPEFAESRLLARAVAQGGFGVGLSSRDFRAGRWSGALDEAMKLSPPRIVTNGAERIAERIAEVVNANR